MAPKKAAKPEKEATTNVQAEKLKALEHALADLDKQFGKGAVMKMAPETPREAAETLAGRTRSQVVMVIGRKFVLYKPFKENPKIVLP